MNLPVVLRALTVCRSALGRLRRSNVGGRFRATSVPAVFAFAAFATFPVSGQDVEDVSPVDDTVFAEEVAVPILLMADDPEDAAEAVPLLIQQAELEDALEDESGDEPGVEPDAGPEVEPAPASAVEPVVVQKTAPARAVAVESHPGPPLPPFSDTIRLNLQGASLDTVLEHLSTGLGLVVVKEADLEGTIDVVSHQDLTREEAVDLLNTVLNAKGLVAVQSDRKVRIVTLSEAKTYDLPVQTGADPEAIRKTESMVTQIIPVRYADAARLLDNLRPLLPGYSSVTANESSNALVVTDTQTMVRRIATIVKALDTSISTIAEVKVFPLQYADSEQLAELITAVFEAPADDSRSRSRGDRMREYFSRMRGGSGGGGDDRQQSSTGTSAARSAAVRVKAVADQHSNSVVVSAPAELMDDIELLVKQVDVTIDETTQLRVFILKYAEAATIAASITDLFNPDDRTNQRSSSGFRGPMGMFGGGPPGTSGRGGSRDRGSSDQNGTSRQLQEARVNAVADTRTNSVVVTASPAKLAMIEQMIKQLDETPKNVPQVYVYQIEHADLEKLQETLEAMFDNVGQTSGTSRTGGTSRTPAMQAPTGSAGGGTTSGRRFQR